MKTRRIHPYRFTVAIWLALVVTLGFVGDSTKVFAVPFSMQYYGANDVTHYNPDAMPCAPGSGSLRGATPKEKIWNYLVDKGLTAEQAAGVMGNMDAESGFVATRRQADNSKDIWNSNFDNAAWGLAQWDGGRRYTAPNGGILGKLREKHPDLEKYTAPEYGRSDGNEKVPAADLDTLLLFELDYLYDESTNRPLTETNYGRGANEWETLKLQKTVDDATVFWHNNFEVSRDTASVVLNGRGAKSQRVFDEFSGKTAKAGGSSGCKAANGDLVAKTLEYAWPKYSDDQAKKPEYETAVTNAKKDGRYTGDPCYGGGVDCGAFVTLLVNDSGFDPGYNYDGKGGNTVSQRAWSEANWTSLGNAASINPADLQPGDVAHLENHTYIFVGKDIGGGFGAGDPAFTGVASASQCLRGPMAGHESLVDPAVTWFRKK